MKELFAVFLCAVSLAGCGHHGSPNPNWTDQAIQCVAQGNSYSTASGCREDNGNVITSTESSHKATQWEHGWETDVVTASRYTNPDIGYNIGFVFKRYSEKADRAELFDYFKSNGGSVYEGGGSPDAPDYVIFDNVKSRDDADKFLPVFLPKLSSFVENLR